MWHASYKVPWPFLSAYTCITGMEACYSGHVRSHFVFMFQYYGWKTPQSLVIRHTTIRDKIYTNISYTFIHLHEQRVLFHFSYRLFYYWPFWFYTAPALFSGQRFPCLCFRAVMTGPPLPIPVLRCGRGESSHASAQCTRPACDMMVSQCKGVCFSIQR